REYLSRRTWKAEPVHSFHCLAITAVDRDCIDADLATKGMFETHFQYIVELRPGLAGIRETPNHGVPKNTGNTLARPANKRHFQSVALHVDTCGYNEHCSRDRIE